jgi:hypothetical protein
LLAAVVMGSVAAGFLVVAAVDYSDLLLAAAATVLKLYQILHNFMSPQTHLILTSQNYDIK